MMKINIARFLAIIAITAPLIFISSSAGAQDDINDKSNNEDEAVYKKYIIYTSEKRTQANFLLPMNFYFNSAFDSAQVPTAFKQAGYFKRYGRIFDILAHLPRSIEEGGGLKKLLIDEWTSTRAIPNYTLHIIGGGYDFRMIAEWYKYNNVPVPYFFSLITCYAAHISNEALENSNKNLTPHDHIADLLFFDWAGKLLFLSNDVARFFNNTLQMRNWLGQPMFDVRKMRMYNASCNYVFRPFIYKDQVRFFFFMGYHYLGGFGFKANETDFITFAAGVAVIGGFNPNKDSLKSSLKKFRPSGGIFYDRNGNLLASLIVNGTENYKFRFNFYPDFLNIDTINFGVFLGIDDYNRVSIGITMYTLIGLSATF
jgi:hypothetical protein